MHHADADVRLADFDIPHLLVEQAFGDGLLSVGLEFTEGDVVPGTHVACRLRIRGIDFRLRNQGSGDARGGGESDQDAFHMENHLVSGGQGYSHPVAW